MINKIAIVANGYPPNKLLSEIRKANFIIGVDKAAYWLINNDIIPDLAIGDFDSVNITEINIIKSNVKDFRKYPPEKDFTDLELALKDVLKLKPKEVHIYGSIGTRFDHTLSSVLILQQCLKKNIMTKIIDENNEIMMLKSKLKLFVNKSFPYVSIIPISEAVEISLTGFIYNLNHKRINNYTSIAVSNQIKNNKATISIHKGVALVIRSRD